MRKIIIALLFVCISIVNLELVHANSPDEMPTIITEYESITESLRNTVRNYREKGVLKVAIDYCHATIKSKPSKEIAIESYFCWFAFKFCF